ncbi:MAG: acyltransferase family protein [Sulfuricurvum sp.]|uniref:acyltransferase family protein n=1 Tax=Sulfuricurvum sp. TaxID=2025608 RepID=UPI0035673099
MNNFPSRSTSWNETLNTIKAFLILSVVVYHLMSAGSPVTKIIVNILGMFQMPLFFGISGFLIKKSLFSLPTSELGTKYYRRIIIPYLLAFIVYSIVKMSILNPLYPANHMWFIPAFLLMIGYVFLIERFHFNQLGVLIAASLFTAVWLTFVSPGNGDEIAYYLGDKRYYYFFVFLYFGYILRNYPEKIQLPRLFYPLILLLSGFVLFIIKTSVMNYYYSIGFLLFNLSLTFIIITFAQRHTGIKIPIISNLGSYTLPIYLWHMLPLFFMWKIRDIYHIQGIAYLGSYFILLSVMIYFIVKSKNTYFTRVFLTGTHK